MQEYKYVQKSDIKRINLQDLKLSIPDLKNIQESKVATITTWMETWIKKLLK